jgi:hypothetical protein
LKNTRHNIIANISTHFGDRWARTQYILKNIPGACNINCGLDHHRDVMHDIINSIDHERDNIHITKFYFGKSWNFLAHSDPFTSDSIVYETKYYNTKQNWKNTKTKNDTVCYSFDSNYCSKNKTPDDINNIIEYLTRKGLKLINIGSHMKMSDVIAALASCRVFVSVDNGLAHVARSVECPHIIIKHLHDETFTRAFAKNTHNYYIGNGVSEVIKLLEEI